MAEMTPGFTGADVKNLVNTAISQAVNTGRPEANHSDMEYARDRIMMGIERKNITQTDVQRFHTALHEAGHAIACYFTPGARKLYKATIVSRGSSLGAVRNLSKFRHIWFLTNKILDQSANKDCWRCST